MRRLSLVVLAAALLAMPGWAPAAAEDLPAIPAEPGTVQTTGVLTHRKVGQATEVAFHAAACVHTFVPGAPGYLCKHFLLSGRTGAGGLIELEGSWASGTRTYTMQFLVPDLVFEAGLHVATGTVSSGAKTGLATFTFVTSPHVDPEKASFVGTLDYALT